MDIILGSPKETRRNTASTEKSMLGLKDVIVEANVDTAIAL